MRIEVTREACCSQDDQLGPLSLQIELPEESLIWELAREIGEANFLQFSSPHNCSGLIKPDTKLGGKIKPSNEVNNDNRSPEFYSRI